MNKLYDRIDFVNNTTPALNETNLDLMSKAIDDIDDRVIEIAGDVLVVVPEILEKYADIEALATNPPYIGQNGNWWTWDTDTNQYVDSGVDAGVSVTVGTTTTLPAGSSATVTNSGTPTDPILNFGIPAGVAGQNGQDGADGADGVSPTVTIETITGGHSVTITDADHPSGQTFSVLDGEDGVGIPSGGTTSQVLKKASGANYDTEWADESGGGSGGHTIINSAGTDMTQRTGLQFSGLNVTDDSTNDKTVVTLPTPDYVDIQYNPSTSWIAGMTCISGNIRYRCKVNNTGSQYAPPNATYWEELSVVTQITRETVLYTSPSITSWTEQAEYNRYLYSSIATATEIANIKKYTGINKLFLKGLIGSGNSLSSFIIPLYYDATISSSMYGGVGLGVQCEFDVQIYFPTNSLYVMLIGNDKGIYSSMTFNYQIVGIG